MSHPLSSRYDTPASMCNKMITTRDQLNTLAPKRIADDSGHYLASDRLVQRDQGLGGLGLVDGLDPIRQQVM